MKPILQLTWACAVLAFLSMVVGHLEPGKLNLVADEISLYAVKAPLGGFIQVSILLSALALFLLGVLVSRYTMLGSGVLAQVVLFLAGAATAGLVLIARFKETVPAAIPLKTAGIMAIRIQSFHDAGFLLFFNSAIYLAVALGILIVLHSRNVLRRTIGIAVAALGPLAHVMMRSPWPEHLFGFHGATIGAHERAALFCLWLAVVASLAIGTFAEKGSLEMGGVMEVADAQGAEE